MDSALIASVTGIVVAGVVGPAISSWAVRRADAQRFKREQRGKQRDDLRAVVDEAAALLAVGATNIRRLQEARASNGEEPEDVRDWASNVHALQQRLLLRVDPLDPVATAYQEVRDALIALDQPQSQALEEAVHEFEAKRLAFLSAARAALETVIS